MARPKSELGDIRTSARSVRLLRWLRREPLPAKVVGETDDGDETSCAVAGKSTKQLHDVVSVVRGCTEFKALDKDGNELRRMTLDPSDPELRAEAEAAAVKSLAGASGNGSVPIISVDLPKLVDNIARNIREASSEAARQSAHAHRGGYDAMISVVNVALNLLVGVENRLNALQDEQQRQQRHQQQGEPDPAAKRQELAMLALQKAVGGNGGSSNGNGGGGVMELMKFMQAMKDAPSGDENNAS
ncbi:MAG TPA: hypothetical protein VFE12_07150 [Acetobacteraceae bacterium]|jgi:hypothetical protein|nr:hypothetical protein [Acetobacteraceae bacterium]